jgi:hypothetical protein
MKDTVAVERMRTAETAIIDQWPFSAVLEYK